MSWDCDCHSFSDISVPPGSVATQIYKWCGGMFNKYFAANLLEKLTAKNIWKSAESKLLPHEHAEKL